MPDARTTHPTPRQLADYGLGKLNPAELAGLDAHLAGCPECRRAVEDQPPDSFIGRLRAAAPRSQSDTALPPRRPGGAPPELAGSEKYELLGKVGQGGMGAVYKARHTFLDEVVAVKVLNAETVGDPDARARFLREMRAAGGLKHRHIVRALDA